MPATASVKLDVNDTTKNSLSSMQNAITAPIIIWSTTVIISVFGTSGSPKYPSYNFLPKNNIETFTVQLLFDQTQKKPSKPIVNGNIEAIIHGCIWYTISTGLCSPSLDFCMINCAKDHLIPLTIDANSRKTKPSALNSDDLYVKRHRPPEIITTMPISDQLCKSCFN